MRVTLSSGYLGRVQPSLEDVASLTMLPMFGEANAVGIILEEDDQVKLKFLTIFMTSSRMSGKLTQVTRLRFFDKGDGSRTTMWWRPSQHTSSPSIYAEWPNGRLNLYLLPLAILIAKGSHSSWSSSTFGPLGAILRFGSETVRVREGCDGADSVSR